MDGRSGFADLLRPLQVETFFRDVYETRPMLVERGDAGFYGEMFGISDLDTLLHSPVTSSRFIRMHRDGEEIPAESWSRGGHLDVDRVCRLFRDGATLIINGADRFFPRIDEFCQVVEAELRIRVQPNIYVTPATERGFSVHYDDHDVFIMQIFGTKLWRLYRSAVTLPCRASGDAFAKHDPGEPAQTFDLHPGDLLYIPRGYLHDAVAREGLTGHITFGLHPHYLFDIVDELAQAARDREAFRRAVPPRLSPDHGSAALRHMIREMLHDLVDEIDIGELLERLDRRFIANKRPVAGERFSSLLLADGLTGDSVVRRRGPVVYRIDREDGQLRLRTSRNTLAFPLFLEAPLRAFLSADALRIADAPGLPDPAGMVALARQLTELGLLEVIDIGGAGEAGAADAPGAAPPPASD